MARRFERRSRRSTIPLAGGDLVVFFTDGISEAMNEAEDCSANRASAPSSSSTAHLPFDELRERILREVRAFAGRRRRSTTT